MEETDNPDQSRKANKSNKQKRILDTTENVYLVQLSWRGAGRLILEEKDKVSNEHGMLTETYSDPVGGQGWSSPSNIRRHSRYTYIALCVIFTILVSFSRDNALFASKAKINVF